MKGGAGMEEAIKLLALIIIYIVINDRGNKQKSRRTSPALFCVAMFETIKLSFRYNNFSIFFKLSQLLSFDKFLKLKIGKGNGKMGT